jgi:CheY-like chemotaxis protein
MDGCIAVSSKEGEGSTFTFTARLEPTAEQAESPQNKYGSILDGISILIIDDVQAILESLSKQLKAWTVSTECANNQVQALELIKKQSFDIVILDSKIPNTDSHALCSELLSASKNTNIKVAMLTSLTDLSHHNDFAESSVTAFLPKPVTPNNLFVVLRHLLSDENISLNTDETIKPTKQLKNTECNISGQHVLLVEDNTINQILAETLLGELGIHVTIAIHGVEALEVINRLASEGKPDFAIILMDCQMPEMDGYETTRQLRRGACGEAYKAIPIIAMTANAIAGDREKCLDSGMDDYLSKPIDTAQLESKLEQWIATSLLALDEQTPPKVEPKPPVE